MHRRIEEAIDNAAMLLWLARDLPGWLRRPATLEGARARIRHGLVTREARFLALAERTIYRHGPSPYRALLGNAGCQLGDLRRLVASEGLEGALTTLSAHGVYVTVDEMKGRVPIVRGSLSLNPRSSDFDNPLSPLHLLSYSSGSGGQPTRIRRSLTLVDELLDLDLVFADVHGHTGATPVFWIANTLARIIRLARIGVTTMHWLYPVQPLSWQIRALTAYVAVLAGLAGRRLPGPVYLGLDQPEQFASWLANGVAATGPALCLTTPSSAVRAAVAATATGRSLRGVTFVLRGEALTDARRRDIETAGAYLFSVYGAEEADAIAVTCAAGVAADDSHVMTHRFALTGRDRPVWEGGPMVRALQVTSLTEGAPKICLNADMGDCGDVDVRGSECCGLGALGLTTHTSNVRSFEKLTGEGMTVIGAGFLRLVEEILPSRFGGSSVDYQLVEQENAAALTELVLRVHPRVGPVDEVGVRDVLLAELARGDVVDRQAAEVWRRLQTVRVSREAPLAGSTGKVLPFRIVR